MEVVRKDFINIPKESPYNQSLTLYWFPQICIGNKNISYFNEKR